MGLSACFFIRKSFLGPVLLLAQDCGVVPDIGFSSSLSAASPTLLTGDPLPVQGGLRASAHAAVPVPQNSTSRPQITDQVILHL